MTVSSAINKNTYSGDGSTTTFAFSFSVLDETHILVEIKDTNGTITTKVLTTDYTVTGTGNTSGATDYTSGNVVFGAGDVPAATDTVIIRRNIALLQETDYIENDPFPAETHEDALDKLTMISQQQQEELDRSVKLDPAVTTTIGALGTPAANQYLKRNSDNDGFNWVTLSATAGLGSVEDDVTPQLGGILDSNSKQIRWSKGADVASATALTLGTDGNYFDVTGTTTITSIATLAVGTVVGLHFDGALTLTHDATDLILPGGANITTAAGDEFIFVEYATGDWRCIGYALASGKAIVETVTASSTNTLTNKTIDANNNTITDLPYDIAFNAGYDATSVKEDVAVQTYAELVMARSGEIVGEAAYADVAPTGAALILDIEKNGTTVYTTKPQFAATSQTLTAGTLKTDGSEDFVSGDRITFKITQVGSTEPGEGVRFTLKCEV